MVLPAGARTFRREWAALIPRGATVALCHDADEHGDDGADRAARIIGGRTHPGSATRRRRRLVRLGQAAATSSSS